MIAGGRAPRTRKPVWLGHARFVIWALALGCGETGTEEAGESSASSSGMVAPPEPGAPLPAPNFGEVQLSRGFLPDPHVVEGTSGGLKPASERGEGCAGWITESPDHVLRVGEPLGAVRVLAWSSDDVTLLVQNPDGHIECADDSYGTHPAIDLETVPSGSYGIWVGSYEVEANSTYRLGFSELLSTRPSALAPGD